MNRMGFPPTHPRRLSVTFAIGADFPHPHIHNPEGFGPIPVARLCTVPPLRTQLHEIIIARAIFAFSYLSSKSRWQGPGSNRPHFTRYSSGYTWQCPRDPSLQLVLVAVTNESGWTAHSVCKLPYVPSAFESHAKCLAVVGALPDDTGHKELLDSRPRHPRVGFATECDGLGDLRLARSVDTASRPAPGPPCRADDKPRA